MTQKYNVTALPKWAQDHIKNLRREVEELKAKVGELSEPGETNTSHNLYGPVMDGTPRLYLPNSSRVRFDIADRCSITCGVGEGGLEITSNQNLVLRFRGTGWLFLNAEK